MEDEKLQFLWIDNILKKGLCGSKTQSKMMMTFLNPKITIKKSSLRCYCWSCWWWSINDKWRKRITIVTKRDDSRRKKSNISFVSWYLFHFIHQHLHHPLHFDYNFTSKTKEPSNNSFIRMVQWFVQKSGEIRMIIVIMLIKKRLFQVSYQK